MVVILGKREAKAFQAQIWAFYRHSGRKLPWRNTHNPYKIIVSEVMLQQTQVARVVEKYSKFLEIFPNFTALAKAPLSKVLRAWQGMGYNRRAKYLRDTAQIILQKHGGRVPREEQELCKLPGIGHYTANAILTFAWNKPRVFIETNIRRVFIHHFFPRAKKVADSKLLPLIAKTLDSTQPREWYYALMDYGAQLPKISRSNANARSTHYIRQSPFKGSLRELRGKILRDLNKGPASLPSVRRKYRNVRTREALEALMRDGLVVKIKNGSKTTYTIA